MNQISIRFTLVFIFISCGQKIEISQWRGPERDGIYPETNLLKEWPDTGPDLIWSYEGLGAGHGNVGIGKNKLFVCGMPDSIGILYAFSMKGKLLWKKDYGLEWYKSYSGSRSTPTVVDDLVYFESGQGVVYCYHAESGELIWSVDLLRKFNAENIQWGMAESLLVDGDNIYCTPGGIEMNIVALNRFNGETVWTSTGNRQPAAYCSPILIKDKNISLIVTMTAESIVGINAETGESYWRVEQQQSNKIHANTPLYHEGKILCSSASADTNSGTVQIKLSENGKSATVWWRNEAITNLMNGFILKDGFVYGSPYNKKEWHCLDWETGKTRYISNVLESGVIIYADDMFYCYTHRGEMALIDASQDEFNVVSSFKVPLGTDQHWAHPVIHDRKLYIRHGNAMMVYDIEQK